VTRNCDTQSAADRAGWVMGAVVLGDVSPSVDHVRQFGISNPLRTPHIR
jgi:hypothetical protein